MTARSKILAILSYFCFLVIIPLILSKKNSFVEYHVKQGVVLTLLWILIPFVLWIPLVGWIAGPVLMIFCIIVWIGGVVLVIGEKERPIPIFGTKVVSALF